MEESVLKAQVETGVEESEIGLKLQKSRGIADWYCDSDKSKLKIKNIRKNYIKKPLKRLTDNSCSSLFGINPNPLVIPLLQYFHSFRKVREGNTKLSTITNGESDKEHEIPPSTFKMAVMQLLMSKVGLFEGVNEKDAEKSLDTLNTLVKTYARGEIKKLKSLPNESIDLLVTQEKGDTSYPFDSLSSGQKEIINTLFLIWKNTLQTPGLVLIDEPELHLNSEWHRGFVTSLKEITPWNQYILATHSEDIFASVNPDHRILIEKG